jgi:hypothetical protein
MLCYQVLARFAFHHAKPALVSTGVKKHRNARPFPVRSGASFGAGLKIRRFFSSKQDAARYVSYLYAVYKGLIVSHPALPGGQLAKKPWMKSGRRRGTRKSTRRNRKNKKNTRLKRRFRFSAAPACAGGILPCKEKLMENSDFRYNAQGYKDRDEYLASLVKDYGVEIANIRVIADVLGPSDDFDSLVSELEDFV